MSDDNLRQIRVLHIVSAGGATGALQQSLFMPLLTRLPKARVKTQVVCLSPGAVPSSVLRQNGVPVHEAALSRTRFSFGGFKDVLQATRQFRPDVIQAWGYTAQIVATLVRGRCDWKPKLVWSIAETVPLAREAGFIDRQKLKYAAKFSGKADRIVYTSEAGAAQHRRVGLPDGDHVNIPPGVDATRFKPDPAARRKVREQLQLAPNAFVIGMVAPFQPEYDHTTLLKAVGELIKTQPELAVVLAGHGVQKGNAPLMALVGGGTLGTRVHLLGEWSDVASLFNACDVVCLSATTDKARMSLVMAMLCGVPCVATGMGAQGEVLGQFGVAIEPGSPAAFIKGITRVMQLAPDKRAFMVQSARKHALNNFVYVRSLQKYLQLYFDLIGRESLASDVVQAPSPEVEAAIPAPAVEEAAPAPKKIVVAELADPDSLEAKVAELAPEALPKWRIEQEQKRAELEAQKAPAVNTQGDVLEIFEAAVESGEIKSGAAVDRVAAPEDDLGVLLAPEDLESAAPAEAQKLSAPVRKPVKAEAPVETPKLDAAARMRAAAREELKRASAAMAPGAKPGVKPAAAKPVVLTPAVAAPVVAAPLTLEIEPPAAATPAVATPVPADVLTLSVDTPVTDVATPVATPVAADVTPPAASPAGEFQLELLPDEPLKQAAG